MKMITNLKVGDIFVACDRGKYGHIVTDITTFAYCDDVVTHPFTEKGIEKSDNRIDFFKLTQVRYYRVDEMPDWAKFEYKKEK